MLIKQCIFFKTPITVFCWQHPAGDLSDSAGSHGTMVGHTALHLC